MLTNAFSKKFVSNKQIQKSGTKNGMEQLSIVGILVYRNCLNIQVLNTFEIYIGREFALYVRIENKEVFIINVYIPNKDDIDIFHKL
jgi:tmRNA-binding protein